VSAVPGWVAVGVAIVAAIVVAAATKADVLA
jgi:hypothetical protein